MADVANRTRLESISREINLQLVFHVAAYKNVELMDVFFGDYSDIYRRCSKCCGAIFEI